MMMLILLLSLVGCDPTHDPSLDPRFDARQQEPPNNPDRKQASPPNPQRTLLFGDLHIHTSLSSDAYLMGVRALPDDAYRFAKGEVIAHAAGYPIQLRRPLDFAAVTDHAEYLGQMRKAELDVPLTRRSLRDLLQTGNRFTVTRAWVETMLFQREHGFGFGQDTVDQTVNLDAWSRVIDAAERHNDPGRFTTFIGYEWSADGGDISVHLHRNVIYRSSRVSPRPFSALDSDKPEDLWAYLEAQEREGIAAIAIPHNPNLSQGLMYASTQSDGTAMTPAYAALRNRFEPVSEILQIKGSSATHPLLSPLDDFADFEIADLGPGSSNTELATLKGAYMRSALRTGLESQAGDGFNPFRFGVIGASDSHNASSPVEEDRYHGKLPMMDGSAGLRTNAATLLLNSWTPVPKWSSGGLAGVWATENTRGAIFDALVRRETYATSGTRIAVRFFGSFRFDESVLEAHDLIERAYAEGTPMGGTLGNARSDGSIGFIVQAYKDPDGANLDRVQIVKGWVDDQGSSHEAVFNVAWSGERQVIDGQLQSIGNTVDPSTASYQNNIGAESLTTHWKDPQFDPAQPAFYYLRVLEIPTPRWSTYDSVLLGIEPPKPVSIQERAVTSAIWYQP